MEAIDSDEDEMAIKFCRVSPKPVPFRRNIYRTLTLLMKAVTCIYMEYVYLGV